jgi:hypothetical protein
MQNNVLVKRAIRSIYEQALADTDDVKLSYVFTITLLQDYLIRCLDGKDIQFELENIVAKWPEKTV